MLAPSVTSLRSLRFSLAFSLLGPGPLVACDADDTFPEAESSAFVDREESSTVSTTPMAAGCLASTHDYTLETAIGPHSFAIDESGALWAWGANESGQLGLGTVSPSRPTPTKVVGGLQVLEVKGGAAHTLVRTADGRVWAWGLNASGQLGLGNNINSTVPMQVPGLSGVVQIAVGGDFSFAVTNTGQVWSWGNNARGQLGINSADASRNTPQLLTALTSPTILRAGGNFAIALKNDRLYTWGSDDSGQLGNGPMSTSNVYKPLMLSALPPIHDVAVGVDFVIATSNPSWWVWGKNSHGQLGDGTMTSRSSPTPIDSPSLFGYSLMEAGTASLFVAGPDGFSPPLPGLGLILSAGRNELGQLLRVGPTMSLAPAGDGYLYVDSLAAGNGYTLVQAIGVQAIGVNNRGQLGDGTTISSAVPRNVCLP